MENPNKVVNEEVTTPQPSEGKEVVKEETTPQAGDKTSPNELLAATQVERERRRVAEDRNKLLEEENKALKSSALPDESEDYLSDEGKTLKKEISNVKEEVSEIKEDTLRKNVFATYPLLKEKETEFNDYCSLPENKGMPLKTAAKAFLAENNMLSVARPGLEKTTGGDKTPPTQGMTTQQVKDLRENNYKEYTRLLLEDKIKIVDGR